jgi:hypothetical protein
MRAEKLLQDSLNLLFTPVEFKRYITEASDLGSSAWGGRIYEDACDEGFVMKDIKGSSSKIIFALRNTHIENGDVLFWEFFAVQIIGPATEIFVDNISCVIYND